MTQAGDHGAMPADPAAADDAIAIVKDRRLARRDGPLRLVQHHLGALPSAKRVTRRDGARMAVADLHRDLVSIRGPCREPANCSGRFQILRRSDPPPRRR